jgi:predicted ATPase
LNKIGFTGSQGTGKTTLAKGLLKDPDFADFVFVPSTARVAEKEGFKVNRDADPLSQLLTTVGRITAEYQAGGLTISDRTPLDSLAYTTYQFNNVWHDFNSSYYWKQSYSLVEKVMGDYNYVFYFPPLWAPKDDGLRDPDVEYQHAIDELVLTFIDSMGVPAIPVPAGDTASRVAFVKGQLRL